MPIGFAGGTLTPPGNLLVAAPGTGNWTVTLWLRTAAITYIYPRTVWYLNNGHVLRVSTSNQAQFYYGSGSDNFGAITPAQWTHIAVTKQGTTAARYYLNGAYQSQRTTGFSSDDSASSVIGNWPGSSDYISSYLDQVTVWDAVLTDGEIAHEYATRRPKRTANLRAWYPFLDKSAADFVRDYSGNGRDLTITGYVAANSSIP